MNAVPRYLPDSFDADLEGLDFSRVYRPLDTAHVDHFLLDVPVRYGPPGDQVCERPWFTPVFGPWSLCVLGYARSFDSPGVYAVFAALLDLFDRHGRLPNQVVVDGPPEFGSVAFNQLCASTRMEMVHRSSGCPRFVSVIEGLSRTVNSQLVHVLPGNTQLLKDPRRVSRQVDRRRDAWSLADLDAFLERFLFEDYPSMPHSGLNGMTPRECFEQGVVTSGSGRVLSPSEQADLRFLLWPPARRRRTVHPRKGIVVDGVRYWHESMCSADVAGNRVEVRLDPHDVGHVAVFIAGA